MAKYGGRLVSVTGRALTAMVLVVTGVVGLPGGHDMAAAQPEKLPTTALRDSDEGEYCVPGQSDFPCATEPQQQTSPACEEGIGNLRPICNLQGLSLRGGDTSRLAALDQYGGWSAHLLQVMRAPGAIMERGACGQQAVKLEKIYNYCFPGADQTNAWMPQGITGEAESGWRDVAGKDIVIISSYFNAKGTTRHEEARISILDNDTRKLVHVPLVEARQGRRAGCRYQQGVSLCGLKAHAGGLAWSGKHLYVAGTNDIHVFDLGRFIPVADGYVLPETGRYLERLAGGFSVSYLSVDTSRRELIVGEYDERSASGRIIHWPLRTDGALASTRASYAVRTVGSAVSVRLQGVAAYNEHYFLAQSGNKHGARDTLFSMSIYGQPERYTWVRGAEDLYLDPRRGLLWGAGEHVGQRSLIGVDVGWYLP